MSKKALAYLVFFVVLVAGFWFFVFSGTGILGNSPLPKRAIVQPFVFRDQSGNLFSNANMRGKVCVVEYFFTTCRGSCPKMNNNLKDIYTAFLNEPDFLIISHTVDPETDSVPRMKHYADSIGADKYKWVFLTGRKDSLYNMARFSYDIADPKLVVSKPEDDFIHTQLFALVDKNGNVRGRAYDGLKIAEMEQLKKDIKGLLKERTMKSNFANGVFSSAP